MITRKDQQFMDLSLAGSKIFSTCRRRQYMAIIVNEANAVVSIGYNGAPSSMQHCVDGGCPRAQTLKIGEGHGSPYGDCIAQHAEAGALIRANYAEIYGSDCTMYINGIPCYDCAKLIATSSIKRLVYLEDSDCDSTKSKDILNQTGVELISLGTRQE